MVKHFCDLCENEIPSYNATFMVAIASTNNIKDETNRRFEEVCECCKEEIRKLIVSIRTRKRVDIIE